MYYVKHCRNRPFSKATIHMFSNLSYADLSKIIRNLVWIFRPAIVWQKASLELDSWIFMPFIFGQYVYVFFLVAFGWRKNQTIHLFYHICFWLSPSRTSMNFRAGIRGMELLRNQSWKMCCFPFIPSYPFHSQISAPLHREKKCKTYWNVFLHVPEEKHTME